MPSEEWANEVTVPSTETIFAVLIFSVLLALALYFGYYNFCRDHETLHKRNGKKCSPAMEAGLTDRVWSVGELLQQAA